MHGEALSVRRVLILVLLALVGAVAMVAGGPPSARARVDGACSEHSWVGGSVDLCDGTLVYRDYVYDDYGAETGRFGAGLSEPAGDGPRENLADIVELRVGIDGDVVRVSFELNSLSAPDQVVAAVAIDTDGDASTGGGQWGPLPVSSEGWEVLATFDRGDPTTNMIEGAMPRPSGSRWGIQAVTASGGEVLNAAFRGVDETGTWWDEKQAAALGEGDISAFRHVVDVADLTSGVTRPAPPVDGLHERVYTSAYTVPPGEGVGEVPGRGSEANRTDSFAQSFRYLGKYQPYGVYVPKKPGPYGVQLALHGFSANHSSLVAADGMQQVFGEDLNRIIVVPLGRGEAGYYSDYSERDVLDVLDDVQATYDIDRDRVFSGGYSMGGYGTLRFASLYPDRFAGYTNWVGFTGDCMNGTPFKGECPTGAVGNVIDLVKNLRSVPGTNWYAGADELVHVQTGIALNEAMSAASIPYVYYLHPAAEHFTPAVLDDWRKEATYTKDLVRVKRPPRVVYRTDASLGNPALGIAHDKAYWVSKIVGRAPGYIDVDLMSAGCGGSEPVLEPTIGGGPDPVPYVSQGAEVVGHRDIAPANRLEGTLSNLAALQVDVAEACLSPGTVIYKLVTDGPVTLALSDGRVLSIPAAGTHEGEIAPLSTGGAVEVKGTAIGAPTAAPAAAPAAGDRLPATGGEAGLAGIAGVMVAAALVVRRSTFRAA